MILDACEDPHDRTFWVLIIIHRWVGVGDAALALAVKACRQMRTPPATGATQSLPLLKVSTPAPPGMVGLGTPTNNSRADNFVATKGGTGLGCVVTVCKAGPAENGCLTHRRQFANLLCMRVPPGCMAGRRCGVTVTERRLSCLVNAGMRAMAQLS